MHDKNIGSVIIADGSRPRGIVTDRDIAMAVAARLEGSGGGGDSLENRAKALGLTARELEVLHWVREGKTNPEIALLLGYSELSAFSRAFTRWTGTSPRHYRRMKAGH